MNLQNISPRVMKRLEKLAEAEEKKFQADLSKEREKLERMKQDSHYIAYGDRPNLETIISIQGTPCVVTTGSQSQITDIKELTQEVYNEMSLTDKSVLKQYDNILATRLEHNDYKRESKSDRYYEVFANSVGQKIDLVEELGRDYEKEYGPANDWEYFSSVDNRMKGISKRAESLSEIYSDAYRIQLGKEILDQEDKVNFMIENGDFPAAATSEGTNSEGGATE